MKNTSVFSLLVGLISVACAWANAQETVHLCADTWMPYNGDPSAETPGYVIEFAREVFESQGLKLEYTNMPWEETLAATRDGTIDGAIGANKEEGEGLVLPSEAVGAPKMILLTRKDSKWNYQNIRSFNEIRLGVISEYSYWELLDTYIGKSDSESVYQATGENPLADLFAKLDAGEIDALIDSESVIIWKLREEGKTRDDYRAVYRHIPDPVYVAFSPTEKGKRYAQIFDAGMKAIMANGRANQIAARYGLREWR